MFPSRKKFRFQITPSDRQLWAIGMVAVTWTLLENLLQWTVYGIAPENDPIRIEYDRTRSFKIRLDLLEKLVEERLAAPYDKTLLDLIISVRDAQLLRDRIIHGSWGDDGVPSLDEDTRGAFNWMKPHPPFDWKLNYGAIRAVAERIDALSQSWWLTVHAGELNGQDVLMTDALQRKLRKPDQTS